MSEIKLHHIDCIEFMKMQPDKKYPLAIVDPPYQTQNTWSDTAGKGFKKGEAKKIQAWDIAPPAEYWTELKRVSENQIVWGANYFYGVLGNCYHNIVWDKGQRGMHFSDAELAWTSFSKKAVVVYEYSIKGHGKKEKRIHQTQKPTQLYKWLLSQYAEQGQRILDTHGGSMSIALACHDMDFDLDLCEIDEEYFKNGQKRLETHMEQLRMW